MVFDEMIYMVFDFIDASPYAFCVVISQADRTNASYQTTSSIF